ncbi:hypothetical protein M2284_002468 [Rhodococcus sp. LBL1]|nr:hypothetical protein [Rhodococcus sp. LBL1]MDH6683852.1 hypothetical protein [Rhodococcus sp. LBL2]
MAWEWVAPVVTGMVGVVGIGATWSAQHVSRKHAADLARVARIQDRRQAAYERILLTALKTTEFVEYADVVWVRLGKPPDVDDENFDMWILADLHTTPPFREAYGNWLSAVDATREIGDELDEDEFIWEQPDAFVDRYTAAAKVMRERYNDLVHVARIELNDG